MTDLSPRKDPIEIRVNPYMIIIMSFLFALIFWAIGLAFRYYVYVGGSV